MLIAHQLVCLLVITPLNKLPWPWLALLPLSWTCKSSPSLLCYCVLLLSWCKRCRSTHRKTECSIDTAQEHRISGIIYQSVLVDFCFNFERSFMLLILSITIPIPKNRRHITRKFPCCFPCIWQIILHETKMPTYGRERFHDWACYAYSGYLSFLVVCSESVAFLCLSHVRVGWSILFKHRHKHCSVTTYVLH